MWTRRSVLRLAGSAAGAAFAARSYGIDDVAAATAAVENRSPEDVAADETYWREIQIAFTLDRSLINLNNGNSAPAPPSCTRPTSATSIRRTRRRCITAA